MKPAPFTYHLAHDVAEAIALLTELGEDAKILAGGQSLVPMMNLRLARPSALVDITRIPGLSYLRAGPDWLRIGALNREFHFTLYEFSRSPLLMSLMQLLWASLRGGPRVLRAHAESARQHDAILDALRAGDPEAAATRTYQHIMDVQHLSGPSSP